MADSLDLQKVTTWITKLALLVSGGRTKVTGKQIGVYAVTCLEDLPASAFSDASLKAIALGREFFPTCSALVEALRPWVPEQPEQASPRFPAPPDWLVEKLLTGCSGQPGPALADWLRDRGVVIGDARQ